MSSVQDLGIHGKWNGVSPISTVAVKPSLCKRKRTTHCVRDGKLGLGFRLRLVLGLGLGSELGFVRIRFRVKQGG
jgi:hypothetical protein